jgi:hypothetical protein
MNKCLRLGIVGRQPADGMFSAGRIDDSQEGEAEVAGSGSREDLPFGMLSSSTEFGSNRAVRPPQVTVVLGADKDAVLFSE